MILQPESMDKVVKANPVPHGMFKKTLDEIEKEKEVRRKEVQETIKKKYEDDPK